MAAEHRQSNPTTWRTALLPEFQNLRAGVTNAAFVLDVGNGEDWQGSFISPPLSKADETGDGGGDTSKFVLFERRSAADANGVRLNCHAQYRRPFAYHHPRLRNRARIATTRTIPAPLAVRLRDITQTVEHFTQIMLPMLVVLAAQLQIRQHKGPLLIRYIARISLPIDSRQPPYPQE